MPGCGKGYDVLLLSAFGYDAYGLEISSRALDAARNTEKEMNGKGLYETREGVEKGGITWLAGDFFKDEFLKDVKVDGKFDLIYDYTVSKSFYLREYYRIVANGIVLIRSPTIYETCMVKTLRGAPCSGR